MIRVRDVMRELRRRSATSRAKNEATLANALENSLPAFWDFRTGDVVVHGHQIQDDDAVKSNTQLQAHEFTVVEVVATDVPVTLVDAVVRNWITTLPTTLTILGTTSCANTGTSMLRAHNASVGRSGSLL
jgi:hypothetical protein